MACYISRLVHENLQISLQFDSILHTLPKYCPGFRADCAGCVQSGHGLSAEGESCRFGTVLNRM